MSNRWTEEEERYLLANFSQYDAHFLSDVLDRSASAIEARYKMLLDKEMDKTPRELEFILLRADRVKPKQLKKKMKGTLERTAKLSKWSGKGNPYAHTKTGYRPGLDLVLRSGWEANFLRILKSWDIDYEYEPRIFTFPIKRGTKAYTPDVLINGEEWVEIKGYFDDKSRIKIQRFKKYYPEEFENFWIIISKSSKKAHQACKKIGIPDGRILYYEQFRKLFKDQIEDWEGT